MPHALEEDILQAGGTTFETTMNPLNSTNIYTDIMATGVTTYSPHGGDGGEGTNNFIINQNFTNYFQKLNIFREN